MNIHELHVELKRYFKENNFKIKNLNKMNKLELTDLYNKYIKNEDIIPNNLLTKENILKNIELYYLKQNKLLPKSFNAMKKEKLIKYMEDNNIPNISKELIIKETIFYDKYYKLYNIYLLNKIKYNNVSKNIDFESLNTLETLETFEKFIIEGDLDTNISELNQIIILNKIIINVYDLYCKITGRENKSFNNISLPEILCLLLDEIDYKNKPSDNNPFNNDINVVMLNNITNIIKKNNDDIYKILTTSLQSS